MMRDLVLKYIFFCAAVLLLIGAVGALFEKSFAPFVFLPGALAVIFYQFMQSLAVRKSGNRRLQRLRRIAFLSSTLLAAAAYCMFIASNLWVAALLIYSLTTFFLSFRANDEK